MVFRALLSNPIPSIAPRVDPLHFIPGDPVPSFFFPLQFVPTHSGLCHSLHSTAIRSHCIRCYPFQPSRFAPLLCTALTCGAKLSFPAGSVPSTAFPCHTLRDIQSSPIASRPLLASPFHSGRCPSSLSCRVQCNPLLSERSDAVPWLPLLSAAFRSGRCNIFLYNSVHCIVLRSTAFRPLHPIALPCTAFHLLAILCFSADQLRPVQCGALRCPAFLSGHYFSFGSTDAADDNRSSEQSSRLTANSPLPVPLPFVLFGRPSPRPFCWPTLMSKFRMSLGEN